MLLKKKFIQGLCLLSLTFLFCCTPKIIRKLNWQATSVVVDGNPNEWDIPLRFFDEDTKLNYTITNDAKNLYICLRVTDDADIKAITQRGLQLWIDTAGKKNHEIGIDFPMLKKSAHSGKRTRGAYGEEQGQTSVVDTAETIQAHAVFVQSANEMRLTGFRTIPDGLDNLLDSNGLKLAISWNNDNVFIYEAAIPFKTFLKNPVVDTTKVFGISFNFTEIPQRTSEGGGGGGSHGGGGHGMGGGGMRGGAGGSHGGGGGSSEPEQETAWAAFRLSYKK